MRIMQIFPIEYDYTKACNYSEGKNYMKACNYSEGKMIWRHVIIPTEIVKQKYVIAPYLSLDNFSELRDPLGIS